MRARTRRRRGTGATVLLAVALVLGLVVLVGPGGSTPVAGAADGAWTVTTTPADVRAVHVSVLHTGKVLLVAGSGNDRNAFAAGSFETSEWDPATGALRAVATPWDAFCAGHATLPDGRLLVVGGTTAYPSAATNDNLAGDDAVYVYDPATHRYTEAPSQHLARWYPTVTELGDGRQFVLGGLDERGLRTREWEIFDGTRWTDPAPGPAEYTFQPMYPALHLMRDGRLFYSGVNTFGGNAGITPPGLWDIGTNAYQRVPGLTDDRLRDQGASVLLPPAQDQRVLVIGGGWQGVDVDAVGSTAIADLKAASPRFVPGPSLDAAKMYVSAVILPDSTVFETGGAAKSVVFGGAPVMSAQIFHPETNTWTKAATPTVPRVYHSSAVLLPDGRVATFGGNPTGSFEMRIEVFTPPYLQTGTPRPTIGAGPDDLHYGDYASFVTHQAAPIRSVVLVRPGSTTHQSDPNQRLVDLPFVPTGTGVAVTMPTEPNLAPPGWYMLFAVDAHGVPSVAKWVHLEGTGPAPRGGYELDAFGGLHPFAVGNGPVAAPVTRGPYWPGWDIARGVARRPDGRTGYVVDGFGGVHGFASAGAALPPAARGGPYWRGWDIVRDVVVLPDGTGGYVLDGFGGLHPFRIGSGAAPPPVRGAPYWPGQDRARGVTLVPDGSGGYVVDAAGRVHPFRIGGAGRPPAVAPPYVPGAAPVGGIALAPNGAAGVVADGFGGLHAFPVAGGVPLVTRRAPYWLGWSVVRGVAI